MNRVAIAAFGLVVVFWSVWVLCRSDMGHSVFDDFESLESLFSGLAFAAVLVTLHLQRRDLEATQAQMTAQQEEMRQQNETLKLQRFENTFFQMLNHHHELVAGLGIDTANKILVGFAGFLRVYGFIFDAITRKMGELPDGSPAEHVTKALQELPTAWADRLIHYEQNLVVLLELLAKADINESKEVYARLICSQLSAHEVYFLVYWGYRDRDLKRLAEEFCLFRNASPILVPDIHLMYYKDSAHRRKIRQA